MHCIFQPINQHFFIKLNNGRCSVKKIALVIIIIIPIYLFSQDKGPAVEIATQTENFNSNDKIYFTIEPHSQYSTAWYISKITSVWVIDPNPQSSEEYILGNSPTAHYGFQVYPLADTWEPFWHALNKVTIFVDPVGQDPKTEWFYFYIDHRDCGFRVLGTDHTFRFDKDNTDKIYYASGLPIDEYFWTICDSASEGDVITIWELRGFGSHTISCFLRDPTNIDIEPYNSHPKVTWSHADDSNGSFSYEVWRLLTQFRHPIGTWYLIDTVTDKSYVDMEVYIGSGSWGRAYYKIRAKIDDLESDYSDYAYINFQGLTKPLVQNPDAIEITEFKLRTNYPNPFNPSTKISFDIPEKTHVDLAVYDIQGKKVVTLVNEMLETGNYSIEFNSGHLPSGTYLYKLVAGEFIDSKKMMLVK